MVLSVPSVLAPGALLSETTSSGDSLPWALCTFIPGAVVPGEEAAPRVLPLLEGKLCEASITSPKTAQHLSMTAVVQQLLRE